MSGNLVCSVCGDKLIPMTSAAPDFCLACSRMREVLQEEHINAGVVMDWIQATARHAVAQAIAAHEASRAHLQHIAGCVVRIRNTGSIWHCAPGCPIAALDVKKDERT